MSDDWLAKWATTAQPKQSRPLPQGVRTALAGDPQAARYAEGALARACDNIATAPKGTRNHTLNAESWSIGQLVKAGHLDYDQAMSSIQAAAHACGLDDAEIFRTTPRAIGQAEARTVALDPTIGQQSDANLGWVPEPPPGGESAAGGHTTPETTPLSEEEQQEQNEAYRRARIEQEKFRLAVLDEAKRELEHDKVADTITNIGAPTNLADFLNIEDPPITWVLEGLQPVGTRALLAAQAKAGKTTMVSNLIKALADQEQFLGDFFNHFTGTITLIDDELDERMLRRWLQRLNIRNPERVQVVTLRGRLSDFNIIQDPIMDAWADLLTGTDYLILDCLRPVLDACGLDENHEAGIFLNAFDELLKKAHIDNALVVHHMGHSNNRSRGDSRIMDWPDALWKLTREETDNPASKRHFSAFGREVDIKQQPLHYTDGHLTLNSDDGTRTTPYATTPEPWIMQTLYLKSGGQPRAGSWLEDRSKEARTAGQYAPSRTAIRTALETLTERNVLTQSPVSGGKRYTLNPDHKEVQALIISD